ncbi:MAG: hypothetical protein JNG89_05170 [Planctomycetaceae bacterium]|nr:hypothetical protein [Planctomycetaceae bacterium]
MQESRGKQIWLALGTLALAWIVYRSATIGAGSAYVQNLDGEVVSATPTEAMLGVAEFSQLNTLGLWVAAFFTLAAFSFMYRDNPIYKFAESIIVGVSAAYWMVIGFWSTIVPNLLGKLDPAWIQTWAMPGLVPVREDFWWTYIVPLVLGVMLLWRLSPRGGWIGRWPLALVIGSFAGMRLVAFLHADFMSQISNSIQPLIERDEGEGTIDWPESVRNTLGILSMLACLVYFFFSVPHRGAVGKISQVGIWVLMITFGAAFGYTVMGRIALLAIRLEFLFDDWLWLIDPLGRRAGIS